MEGDGSLAVQVKAMMSSFCVKSISFSFSSDDSKVLALVEGCFESAEKLSESCCWLVVNRISASPLFWCDKEEEECWRSVMVSENKIGEEHS